MIVKDEHFTVSLIAELHGYGKQKDREALRRSVERLLRAALHDATVSVRIVESVRVTPQES